MRTVLFLIERFCNLFVPCTHFSLRYCQSQISMGKSWIIKWVVSLHFEIGYDHRCAGELSSLPEARRHLCRHFGRMST